VKARLADLVVFGQEKQSFISLLVMVMELRDAYCEILLSTNHHSKYMRSCSGSQREICLQTWGIIV
jgi:hypothetical protein